ncbi:MAG: FAD-dependent monooxygenase, partial [Fimbriimonadaceae bacterium]|nr:FAD-dependent monooxygenase [Alphaproteobacteria bacterium]
MPKNKRPENERPENERKVIQQYTYERSADQDAANPVRHPVIIVGAGPIGLAAAIDFAQRGISAVLLDDNDRIGEGSRAICFSKRALEVCDRVGVADRMVEKGVTWQVGKVFLEDNEVYKFDLLPETGHKQPAFINLQQYYVEAYLVERALDVDNIDIRWRNKVTNVENIDGGVRVTIDTPDGDYTLEADYLVACDGARSEIRGMLGMDFVGQVFKDRFLIVDVKMTADFPTERWFWFDPPFHKGQSVLLHKQPDDVWRIDFQLGWDADPEEESKPEKFIPRLKAMLGHTDFD